MRKNKIEISVKNINLRRLASLFLTILFIFGLSSFAFVSADVNPDNSQLMNNPPKAFKAYGFTYLESSSETPPFHNLQNQMNFQFTSGKETHQQYIVEYNEDSSYGPAVHTFDLYLTYDMNLLEQGLPFITGTFEYSWDHSGTLIEYSGTAEGMLVEISTDIMSFNTDYVYTNALSLKLAVDGDLWDWTIYLEVPGEEDYYIGSTYVEDDYYNYEETPHPPSPSTQAEVAAGVGISTVGIAAANALTKTSILGSTSFNVPNTPVSPVSASSVPTPSSSAQAGGSGFFNAIKDFFKNLFSNLRDMLTDEGRSFASGKVTDFIEDSDLNNPGDDN
ncbi:MAG: hypothetical protein J7L77_05950 [Clostridiales bacterium]|nr:hypothetical protein [Clostridiales bacterium]